MKINQTKINQYNTNFQAVRRVMPKVKNIATNITFELHSSPELHEQMGDILFDGENIRETYFSPTKQKKSFTEKISDFFKQIFSKQ